MIIPSTFYIKSASRPFTQYIVFTTSGVMLPILLSSHPPSATSARCPSTPQTSSLYPNTGLEPALVPSLQQDAL
ncbi:hypothetical protein P691DRAFT_552023 [Macrolepiota fuliginosa MF-IS2]|uniref:Uncharacterized protein n=1 Tax=Macrolepiota fuliginosa MF-IS2 TaxID=1400762 RepID=A0A9P6C5K7_9AGAR|nr:hypothetical protein P691DRAFT_552023 [Macrolepiota fuliginosa MF-IS2]